MERQLKPASIATGLALCMSLLGTPVQAQDTDQPPGASLLNYLGLSLGALDQDLLPTADDFRLDTHAPTHQFHQQQESPSDPRIKAVNGGERIYLGENLLPGNNAGATDKQSGKLYLEFGQRGAELVFRF